MEPIGTSTWWEKPWLDEEKHIDEMRKDSAASDHEVPAKATTPPGSEEGGDDVDDEDDDDEDDDDEEEEEDEGGGGDGTGGIGEEEGDELVHALTALAGQQQSEMVDVYMPVESVIERQQREKVDPLVDVPDDRGGGRITKKRILTDSTPVV